MPISTLLLASHLGIATLFVVPADEEHTATRTDAVEIGVQILLHNQENYVRDKPVGRLPDDELAKWQARDLERLEELRNSKEPSAEWPYEGVYRIDRGQIPPGYRVGGSAIVCQALVASPGYAEDEARRGAVGRSVEFMLDQLANNEKLEAGPKRGYDVRGWAHTYALDFFLQMLRADALESKVESRVRTMIPHLIQCIAANEVKDGGGWNYASHSTSPFMTGSTLLALFRADAQGFDVDSGMIERALDGLESSRNEEGSYAYSGSSGKKGRSSNRIAMPGACARASIAELSLALAGRSDAKQLRMAVDAFFEHWDELLKRKSQQGTHVGDYGIAPYYFMYGHTYAALAIEALPESDRPALRTQMLETLWKTREDNGGWNDRIFPRSESYSTAMALLALLAPDLDPLPTWSNAAAE